MNRGLVDLHDDGWSLIPTGADKRPMLPWLRYQRERPALDQLQKWEEQYRPPSWAGITGAISGKVVLDFDMPSGPDTMRALGLEPHRRTPHGGHHVDVVAPDWNVPTVNGKSKRDLGDAFPGTDIRADGGYAILTGSIGAGDYTWLRSDHAPLPLEKVPHGLARMLGLLAPAPVALAAAPLAATPAPSPASDVPALLLGRALGLVTAEGRNGAGFWLGCQLRDHGLDQAAAAEVMTEYASAVPSVNTKGAYEPYTVREALESLQQAYRRPPRRAWLTDKPRICATGRQLSAISQEAMDALADANNPERLFRRGGALSRIVRDEKGRPAIDVLTQVSCVHELARAADWWVPEKGGGERDTFPPARVAADILVRDDDALPGLVGLIDAPCLRPDGTVLFEPGYDSDTMLWLEVDPDLTVPPVPENPTGEEISRARALLLDDLLGEFPFVDDSSRANALAFLLTAVLRPALPGLAPMALVDAPVAGSGKTFFVNVCSLVASGRAAGMTAAPGDDEELRKRITSLLIAGDSIVVFDNLSGPLQSSVLAQALTSDTWSDRRLGASVMVRFEPRVLWVATGNNIELGGDLARRCYPIRLDPKMARPWQRAFRRPNLEGWVREHRGELLTAAMTLGRAWYAGGCPIDGAPPWGSFDGWSKAMWGILQVANVPDFLANLDELQDQGDAEAAGTQQMLETWYAEFGSQPVTTSKLLLSLTLNADHELPPSLIAVMGEHDGVKRTQRLARLLASLVGRRYNDSGLRLERAPKDKHLKLVMWKLVTDGRQP